MSAMVMDVRPLSHVGETIGTLDAVIGRNHPRGRGFRVLSRIARTHANDDEGYSPRHRRDDASESDLRALIAG